MIGVFDSGVGGLAVLREIRALLPDVDLLYLADQANAPYGERSLEQVRQLAEACAFRMIDRGVDEVVVACNTASAAALQHLRDTFPDRVFVGMEPAVKPAAGLTRTGVVAVLATPTTFRGEAFDRLVGHHAGEATVIPVACPGWAAAVEDQWPEGSEHEIRERLEPILAREVDAIALACTHYSFLSEVIGRVAGPDVIVIDPAPAVARQVVRVVAGSGGTGMTRYLTTGDPDRFRSQIGRLLGDRVAPENVH